VFNYVSPGKKNRPKAAMDEKKPPEGGL